MLVVFSPIFVADTKTTSIYKIAAVFTCILYKVRKNLRRT